jgi:hypothetical protein
MGGLLNKIFLVDLFQGLWVTFRNQNPKYIYTEQYPTERPKLAERYRGAPRLNINPDTSETLCISCCPCSGLLLRSPEVQDLICKKRQMRKGRLSAPHECIISAPHGTQRIVVTEFVVPDAALCN